jgi:hypothetical protein
MVGIFLLNLGQNEIAAAEIVSYIIRPSNYSDFGD